MTNLDFCPTLPQYLIVSCVASQEYCGVNAYFCEKADGRDAVDLLGVL